MNKKSIVELNNEVEKYLNLKALIRARLLRTEIEAQILATEYYVCAGIGFTKYLN